MTPARADFSSPLGIDSLRFRDKKDETGSILDNPTSGFLELYPAGYTKNISGGNINRQEYYAKLYNIAHRLNTTENLYPFNYRSHNITVEFDCQNTFDSFAMHILLHTARGNVLEDLDGVELGFIPRRISAQIYNNQSLIKEGRILKVKRDFHGKYFGAKVIFSYGNHSFSELTEVEKTRFADLLDD